MRIFLIQFLVLTGPHSGLTQETECSKNPSLTGKKITHILRSETCARTPNFGTCEEAAGVRPGALSGAMGAAILADRAKSFRPVSLMNCQNPGALHIPRKIEDLLVVGLVGETSWALAQSSCTMDTAKARVDWARSDAIANLERLVAEQKQEIENMKEEKFVKDVAFKKAEMAALSQADQDYAKAAQELLDIHKEINSLEEKAKTPAINDRLAELAEQKSAKNRALNGLKPQAQGKLTSEERFQLNQMRLGREKPTQTDTAGIRAHLERQQETLRQYQSSLHELRKAQLQSMGQTPRDQAQRLLKIVADMPAISEAEMSHIQTIRSLLTLDDRSRVAGLFREAQSKPNQLLLARQEAAKIAFDTGPGAGKVAAKILGPVVRAMTVTAAIAASPAVLAAELITHTTGPDDRICLSEGAIRSQMSRYTKFDAQKGCRALPEITELNAFAELLSLGADAQKTHFANPEFCQWLNDVYQLHQPKVREVKCGESGISFSSVNQEKFRVSFDKGEISQLDYLQDAGPGKRERWSLYFQDRTPKRLGLPETSMLAGKVDNFDNAAFTKNQTLVPMGESDLSLSNLSLTSLHRAKITQSQGLWSSLKLSIAEMKSCCGDTYPRVEAATCRSKYNIPPPGARNSESGSGSQPTPGTSR